MELIAPLATEPGVAGAFASRDYRTVSIAYEPFDPVVKRDPVRPYARAHVTVTLESAATGRAPGARVVLDADVSASTDGPIGILRLAPSVAGDPALASLLRPRPQ